MKPILSRKVTREIRDLKEWDASEHHLTDEGREEFRQRQKSRIAAADKARAEAQSKVTTIKKRTA